jgi:hypothetical protein
MPPREDSFPPGFPRNMNELAAMFFGFGGMGFGMRAEPAPPPPPDRSLQPSPIDESRRRASVETLTSYLRLRFHTNASSAAPLQLLASVREIHLALPPAMTLSQLINSQRDVFHVIRQSSSASAVYVDPQPGPSSDSSLSQCVSAISSFLLSRGHISESSALPLSILCDVPSIMRTLPSNSTLSAVIRSSSSFVLLQQSNGAAVFHRPPSASIASSAGITPSTNSSSSNSGAAARTPESFNQSWETYAVAAHRHLHDCGFVSSENTLSIRQLGTVEHLRSLRARSFPPLVSLLRHYPHLISFSNGDGHPRVWAVTGFPCPFKQLVCCSQVCRRSSTCTDR